MAIESPCGPARADGLTLGSYASASGLNTIAVGTGSSAAGPNSVALGVLSSASGANTTAIGNLSTARGDNSVAAGVLAAASAPNTTAFGNLSAAAGPNSTAIGILSLAGATNATAVGNQSAAGGTNSTAIGTLSTAGPDSVSIGSLSSATGQSSAALGNMSQARGSGSVAIGIQATALGASSIAIGSNSTADAPNIVSFGSPGAERRLVNVAAGVLPSDAATYGQLVTLATSLDSRFAAPSTAHSGTITLGTGTAATSVNTVAIGDGAAATGTGSVAIGSGSVASAPNTVAFGSPGNERRITGVAPGVAMTDVATFGQLQGATAGLSTQIAGIQTQVDDNRREARAGTALALATSGLHFDPRPGKASLAAAFGNYKGMSGLAVGLGYAVSDRWRFNAAVTATPQVNDFGVAAGASWTPN
jgi:trimeric autotransporter adhesin